MFPDQIRHHQAGKQGSRKIQRVVLRATHIEVVFCFIHHILPNFVTTYVRYNENPYEYHASTTCVCTCNHRRLAGCLSQGLGEGQYDSYHLPEHNTCIT